MTDETSSQDRTSPDRIELLRESARQGATHGERTPPRGRDRGTTGRGALAAWEAEQRDRVRRRIRETWTQLRSPARQAMLTAVAFLLGLQLAARSDGALLAHLQNEAETARNTLQARHGELELVRLELSRSHHIMDYSRRYAIPADLAAAVYDIALSEGIDPAVAFQLVRIESGFHRRAVSPVGAVGLSQVMPLTALELDPTIRYTDLFDRDTNLRLGFRYLRQMLGRYDGDLRLALLAYNRGPGTVDAVLRAGGDPSNGYAQAVLNGVRRAGPDDGRR